MIWSFAWPLVLLVLPAPWLVWKFVPPYLDQVTALRIPFFRQVTQAAEIEARAGAVVLKRTRFQTVVAVVAWVLIVISLARPERLGEPIVVETAARDIVLALDISGSMDAVDFVDTDGNRQQRLTAVKDVLAEFIAERDGDRIALIIFGTRAFVQAPFTEDLTSLAGFLDQTVVGMAGPNTALGDAIGLAIRTFDASEVDQRLMILLSDGADTSSRMTPINAAAFAAEKSVTIYTIGVGDPEASGEDKVDLAALQAIATRTDGAFFFASDETALTEVYVKIDEQNPRAVETQSYRPTKSLAYVPMALALLLICLSLSYLHISARSRAKAS